MIIRLSKDQEQFIRDAVRAGLYLNESAVMSAALEQLQQAIPKPSRTRQKGQGC